MAEHAQDKQQEVEEEADGINLQAADRSEISSLLQAHSS